MNEMTEGHTVSSYNNELTHLHQLVIQMSEMGRQQLRDAVATLKEKDIERAQLVIDNDREINDLDIQADDQIVHIIAKRQPLAKDLREILTVGKIVNDLERVGDQARWIARLTLHLYDGDNSQPNEQLLTDIPKMAVVVDSMIAKSIESFDQLDLGLALKVIEMNLELENDFKSALRRLSTFLMEDSRCVGHVTDVTLGLRALERAGGHAKNIAGFVVFLAKGMDVRHTDLETIAAEVF